jgi:hypothetical protein
MHSYAILIDGGFAKRKLGSSKTPATVENFQQLVERIRGLPLLVSMRLHRVYYYDAAPLLSVKNIPLNGGKKDFSKEPTVSKSDKLLSRFKEQPFMALRLAGC